MNPKITDIKFKTQIMPFLGNLILNDFNILTNFECKIIIIIYIRSVDTMAFVIGKVEPGNRADI